MLAVSFDTIARKLRIGRGGTLRSYCDRSRCGSLALSALIACLGALPAHGHGDEESDVPMGSLPMVDGSEKLPGPKDAGRQLCSYRPGVYEPSNCGTAARIRPAPPLRGKMLLYEADSFTGAEPTASQQKAADDMVAACQASTAKHGWQDIEKGLASGYELAWHDAIHYVNMDFVFDDAFLDCDKPEYLMYYDTPEGHILAGLMFVTQQLLDEGPQFGGPLTRWHYHYWSVPRCMQSGSKAGVVAIGAATLGECDEGEVSFRSPEMLHLWLFDHPVGPFSAMMHLSDEALEDLASQNRPTPTP